MIGYRISGVELENLIDAEVPKWRERAKSRTDEFAAAGMYSERSSIWSEVKVVYMRLQGNCKCIYCERKLESEEKGLIEQDVEHFRPKGSVRQWSIPVEFAKEGISITDPGSGAPGYHLLPYHLFNYSAACKPCNSTLKSNYFPIAGDYDFNGKSPRKLVAELPLLIYPLGDFDANPETLIKFHGVSPQPMHKNGHRRHRALTTIAFFELANPIKRKNLFLERANVIIALFPQLNLIAQNPGDPTATGIVEAYQTDKAAHANCARSFVRLYRQHPDEAEVLFQAAVKFVITSS